MSKKWSKVSVAVNGEQLLVEGDPTIDLGGIVRTAVNGNVHLGYTESVKESEISCDIVVPAGFSIDSLRNVVGATVTATLDTGQTYVINNAFTVEPPTGSGGDPGKWSVKFQGEPATELTS